MTNHDDKSNLAFVFGKSKLAPVRETTIPRLELCAAVLAVDIAEFVVSELHLKIDAVTFLTDSRIVVGYIHNETRMFYVYVTNRIQQILQNNGNTFHPSRTLQTMGQDQSLLSLQTRLV